MTNNLADVRIALARAVANRKVDDNDIEDAAKSIAASKYPIRGIHVCERGICIDYIIDAKQWAEAIPEIIKVEKGILDKLEVFPWGIVNPDILQVKVTQNLDAIAPRF